MIIENIPPQNPLMKICGAYHGKRCHLSRLFVFSRVNSTRCRFGGVTPNRDVTSDKVIANRQLPLVFWIIYSLCVNLTSCFVFDSSFFSRRRRTILSRIMSKKLINNPVDCVDEGIEGFVMTHPGLRILGTQRVVIRDKVHY